MTTMEWQPIETAPRDGSNVILGHPEHKSVMGVWRLGFSFEKLFSDANPVFYWAMNHEDTYGFDFEPTHCMPLPDPPKKGLTGPPRACKRSLLITVAPSAEKQLGFLMPEAVSCA
jgi:hypothetical protein